MTWEAIEMSVGDPSKVLGYQLRPEGGGAMSWTDVLRCWSESAAFVDFFSGVLAAVDYGAFRWETPGLVSSGLDSPFEFVLVRAERLQRPADSSSFDRYFVGANRTVRFENLGADAQLVVPAPIGGAGVDYSHLGSFLRSAPVEQIHDFWRSVAAAVVERVSDKPLWLSSAGDGVPWLHVRLDDRPKYYAYGPYQHLPT